MITDLNPYESPTGSEPPGEAPPDDESNLFASLFLIVAGLFFCVLSFYSVFGHSLNSFLSAYRDARDNTGFAILFLVFYGFTGGFTCVFHLSHLILGRPKQAIAGIYAIGLAIVITAIGAAILKLIA